VIFLVNLNDFFIVVCMGFYEECDTFGELMTFLSLFAWVFTKSVTQILCLLSQIEREGLGSHFGFLFLYKWVKIMDENKEKFHSYYQETECRLFQPTAYNFSTEHNSVTFLNSQLNQIDSKHR
jgi:hypothetical protein